MKKGSYNTTEIRPQEEQFRKICRVISEISKRLDDARSRSHTIDDLFLSNLIIQRNKFRDHCEKLIFIDPIAYGRKTEELLWRKCYYDVISSAKKLKKKEFNPMEISTIESHIDAGVGHYTHFINELQTKYSLDLRESIDFAVEKQHNKWQNLDEKLIEYLYSSVHRSLIYLGDLNRYKLDLRSVKNLKECKIAIRYYMQAANVKPELGVPYNQLGTLASNHNQLLDAVYYYLKSLNSPVVFEGTEKNLMNLFEKNCTINTDLTAEGENRIKKFVLQFLSLINCWIFDRNLPNVYQICHQLNVDVQECLLYPKPESGKEIEDSKNFIEELLLKMIIVCLMSISKMQKNNSQQISVAVAFTLAIYSQLNQSLTRYIKENVINMLEKKNGLKKNKMGLRRRRKKKKSVNDDSDQSDVEVFDEISDVESEESFEEEDEEVEVFSSMSEEDDEETTSSSNVAKKEKNGIVENHYTIVMDCLTKKKNLDVKMMLDILSERGLLICIKLVTDWLVSDVEILKSCAKSTRSLLEQIMQLINILNFIYDKISKMEKDTKLDLEQVKLNNSKMPLPEDVFVKSIDILSPIHEELNWNYFKDFSLTHRDEMIVRIAKLVDYGHRIVKINEIAVTYQEEQKLFVVSVVSPTQELEDEEKSVLAIKKYSPVNGTEHPKGQLMKMKHMGQLWLAAEVRALESRVKGRTAFSPYLVLDTEALIKYTFIVKHLVNSKKFIVLVPSAVVSALDDIKKEKTEARDAIRWLEAQFQQGNRFFRSQRPQEKTPLPLIKYPKKKDKDLLLYIQIIECCHYLVQQQKAENLVTLLVGNKSVFTNWDSKELSFVGLVLSAGINMEPITKFYGKWKKNYKAKR